MNRNCSACNTQIESNNDNKSRTVCKRCYKKNKRKNNNNTLIQNKTTVSYQQPKIKNGINNDNNRTLLFGPSFLAKTYLLLRIFSRIPDPDFYLISNSPPE